MEKRKRILKTLLNFSIPAIICLSPISAQAGILDEINKIPSEETTQSETYEIQEQEQETTWQEEGGQLYEKFADADKIEADIVVNEMIEMGLRRDNFGDVEENVYSKIIAFYRYVGKDIYEVYIRMFADEDWNKELRFWENFYCFDNLTTFYVIASNGKVKPASIRGFYRDTNKDLKVQTLFETERPDWEILEELKEDITKETGRRLIFTDILKEFERVEEYLVARERGKVRRLAEHFRFESLGNKQEIQFNPRLTKHSTGLEIKTYIVAKEDCDVWIVGMPYIRNSRTGANLIGRPDHVLHYKFTLPGN